VRTVLQSCEDVQVGIAKSPEKYKAVGDAGVLTELLMCGSSMTVKKLLTEMER